MKKDSSGTCPKCRRAQYFRCSNPDCQSCKDLIPTGKLGMLISDDGNFLSCPYCGFTESGGWWEDRSIQQFIRKMGAKTLTEAVAIDQERHHE